MTDEEWLEMAKEVMERHRHTFELLRLSEIEDKIIEEIYKIWQP